MKKFIINTASIFVANLMTIGFITHINNCPYIIYKNRNNKV